jgi:hypothetical protein
MTRPADVPAHVVREVGGSPAKTVVALNPITAPDLVWT